MAGKDAVARIHDDPGHEEAPAETEHVDIDIAEIDEQFQSEATARPLSVRLPAGTVVHFLNPAYWPMTAMRSLTDGAYEVWGREVIEADDEYEAFIDADLKNYQLESIAQGIIRRARVSMGKSRKRAGSSPGRRRH